MSETHATWLLLALAFAAGAGVAALACWGLLRRAVQRQTAELREREERRQLEERLHQAQITEEIRFLTERVAHGFRNLLATIPGYCDLALDGLPADSQSRADIEQIRTHTERALLLIKQVLTPEQDHRPEPPGAGVNTWVSEVGARLAQTLPVESAPGRGSTFRIGLPSAADPRAGEADAGASARSAAVTGQTILVVEDEESVRRFVRNGLVQAGYEVLDAGDGAEALARAAGHAGTIDLLLTDVVMPGMNGKELYDRLATLRPGLPVLYMSGYTQDVIARQGVLEPGTHFLPKPFSVPDLTGKVRGVLTAS